VINVNIKPAKQRFSRRKQWKFEITGANGEPLHPNDTYANTGDVVAMLHSLREDEATVRIYYPNHVQEFVLPANPQSPF
jgi:hypothetical protein